MMRFALLIAAILALGPQCLAADYPTRPITIVVGYAAGGGTDIFARLTADKLSQKLGQAVIVVNKPGANAAIGAEQVARAAPDGYTLLFIVNSHVTNPGLMANLPFDPIKDFKAVGLVLGAPDVIFRGPRLPVNSIKELIDLAKSKPGELVMASPGLGSPADLVGELLKKNAGIKVKTVQYGGALPAINDVLGGTADFQISNIADALPFAVSGKVKLIGQMGEARSVLAPDVPTIAESRLPGLESFHATTWFALLAPAKTPNDIVVKLNQALNEILTQPDLREKYAKSGGEVLGGTPEHAEQFMLEEQTTWLQVMKDIGLTPK